MADADMSFRDVTSVAPPADASLNESIGVDLVQSQITADFGFASAHANTAPPVPQVRLTSVVPQSSSRKFLDAEDIPGDLGIDEDLD